MVSLMLLGFPYPAFLVAGQLLFMLFLFGFLIQVTLLYSVGNPFEINRVIEEKLSNGDYNVAIIQLKSLFPFTTSMVVIDEYPEQLQLRNKHFHLNNCKPNYRHDITYEFRPVNRGVYTFGDIHILVETSFGLVQKKFTVKASQDAAVYPSFIQLRKYAYFAIHNRLDEIGIKNIRRLGASNEFEQIRDYVQGDDFRKINWKATARKRELMVNEFQEERAQNIYCVIDTGRNMHMPFEGLSLLEYAINASLVLLGVAQAKGDRAGLIEFSHKVDTLLPAHARASQMKRIIESLYSTKVQQKDSDYLNLYKQIRFHVGKRSLMVLFTNFNSLSGLKRQLRFLKGISKNHLLLVVLFENTEIADVANQQANRLRKAYDQTIAEKYMLEKRLIVHELNKNGIYTILTTPAELTVNTINKYIAFKAKGVI
ncbi:MAG: DUF58 domain-containing protein [Bacteroidota bacterium]